MKGLDQLPVPKDAAASTLTTRQDRSTGLTVYDAWNEPSITKHVLNATNITSPPSLPSFSETVMGGTVMNKQHFITPTASRPTQSLCLITFLSQIGKVLIPLNPFMEGISLSCSIAIQLFNLEFPLKTFCEFFLDYPVLCRTSWQEHFEYHES